MFWWFYIFFQYELVQAPAEMGYILRPINGLYIQLKHFPLRCTQHVPHGDQVLALVDPLVHREVLERPNYRPRSPHHFL